MGGFLVVAIGGAGGDLPPLIGAALALRDRGHEVRFVGDLSVERTLAPVGVDVTTLAPGLDLGPRLGAAIAQAMSVTGGDLEKAGPMVEAGLADWARDLAPNLRSIVEEVRPDA